MAVELNNILFRYPESPSKTVLDIPSWSTSMGEHVFIQGPSGGGKSTLLNVLSGMLPVTEGHITVLGERLDTMTSRQRDQFRARNIGYVFQQFNLIPYLDAIDNIQLAAYFSKGTQKTTLHSAIKELLTALNIAPHEWTKPINTLSTGQQQRVAIARALVNKPHLLVADEPTSSLDQQNRDTFMSLLMPMLAQFETTLLFVSHDLSLSQYFNRVDALKDINCARQEP